MQETSDKPGTDGLEIIEFEQFDTSFAVSPTDEGKTRRRYMTLLAESEGERSQKTRLSDVQLLHVQNTEGASFVLKRLYPVPQDADPFARRGREAALFEEYRNQLAVSQLKGFPDVFGYGVTHAGDPGEDACLIKTQPEPIPLKPREPEDRGLTDAIMSCIKVSQAERPNARILFREIAVWQKETTDRASTLHHEEIPSRRSGTRLWTSEHQETQKRFQKIQTEMAGSSAVASQASTRHPVITRRSLLISAGVVAAAAVTGFGAYVALRPKSWSEISDIASTIASAGSLDEAASIAHDRGIADEDGSVTDGLTKSIALADGTTTAAQVVGYWHDDTEDGGKAGLTFAFTNPIAARAMADASMPEGGWEQCNMRSWLAEDFMDSLPDELSGIIVPAVKLTNNARSTRTASSITSTTDAIWLFSMAELDGTRTAETFASGYGYLADIVNAEDTQYGC